MDAIQDLAFPLPVMVICELLGVPNADRDRFTKGAVSGAPLLNPTPPTRAELDAANTGTRAAGSISKTCSSSGAGSPATT